MTINNTILFLRSHFNDKINSIVHVAAEKHVPTPIVPTLSNHELTGAKAKSRLHDWFRIRSRTASFMAIKEKAAEEKENQTHLGSKYKQWFMLGEFLTSVRELT